jgi:hypothetical protein
VWYAVVNGQPFSRATARAWMPNGPSVAMCSASGAQASMRRRTRRRLASASRISA